MDPKTLKYSKPYKERQIYEISRKIITERKIIVHTFQRKYFHLHRHL